MKSSVRVEQARSVAPPLDPAVVAGETDASTRHRVAQSILEHGPSTAAELALRLSVTPAAIRRHLTALLEDGCLKSSVARVKGPRGRGRPAKLFALTDAGRAGFRHTYDDLAIGALRALARAGGPDAVAAFARDRMADLERRYRDELDAHPELSPGQVLAAVLSQDGYVASAQPARGGEQLCQHHCPIALAAREFPELCAAETQLFAELLGVHVQRLATIAGGDGVCTTNIPDLPGPEHTGSVVQRLDPRARKAAP